MVDKSLYAAVFDNGKPYEATFNTIEALIIAMHVFYENNKDNNSYMDVVVYDSNGVDISETQLITEIVSDIIGAD